MSSPGRSTADTQNQPTLAAPMVPANPGPEPDPNQVLTRKQETSLLEAISTLTVDAMTQAYEIGQDPVRDA